MQRVRIRTMLNHLKNIQAMEKDVDIDNLFAQLESKHLSTNRGVSQQTKNRQILNSSKFGSFTLDTSQNDVNGSTISNEVNTDEKANSDENKIFLGDKKKHKINSQCFGQFRILKGISISQNLQELGIEKKVITERQSKKDHRQTIFSNHFSLQVRNQDNMKPKIRIGRKISSTKSAKNTNRNSQSNFSNDFNTIDSKNYKTNRKYELPFVRKVNLTPKKAGKLIKQSADDLCPWQNLRASTNSHF